MPNRWRRLQTRGHLPASPGEAGRHGDALARFSAALRSYDVSREGVIRVDALAEVIDSSRTLSQVDEPLSDEDFATLARIRDRYRAFAKGDRLPVLYAYGDARTLLRALFF